MSEPYSPEAAALNNASIVGARLACYGLHAMEKGMHRNGPPFYSCNVDKHNKDISKKACEVAKNSCVAAAKHLHIVMDKPLDEVLDVTVDGIWQKPGCTSLWYCCGIAWNIGQVLAWEVLSKHCMACKLRKDLDLEEYKKW